MSLKKNVYDGLSRLGFEEFPLKLYDYITDEVNSDFDADVDPKLQDGWEMNVRGSVLLPITHSSMGINTLIVFALAHGFRARGYEPVITACNQALPTCFKKNIIKGTVSPGTCHHCVYSGKKSMRKYGVEEFVRWLETDSVPDVPLDQTHYGGMNIARFAMASTRKITQKYTIDLETSPDRDVYANMLRSSAFLVDLYSELYEDRDFNAVLAPSPLYFNGGIPLALAQEANVPAYGYGVGYRDETLAFHRNDHELTLRYNFEDELVSEGLQTTLTSDQLAEIDMIIEGRKTGESTRVHYSSSDSISPSPSNNKIGVFTNLLWDGSFRGFDRPYMDAFEWLFDTIDTLSQTDATFIVKTHPAETLLGTNESVYERIRDEYEQFPENMRLLEPDTDVDTYDLLAELDAGVVYTSTVGLEMAYMGIPVLVGGDPHYCGHGFTFDPVEKDAYRQSLQHILNLEMNEIRQNGAKRYAYHLFVSKHIPFPFFSTGEDGAFIPHSIRKEDLKPGTEPMDTIVYKTVRGEPVLTP